MKSLQATKRRIYKLIGIATIGGTVCVGVGVLPIHSPQAASIESTTSGDAELAHLKTAFTLSTQDHAFQPEAIAPTSTPDPLLLITSGTFAATGGSLLYWALKRKKLVNQNPPPGRTWKDRWDWENWRGQYLNPLMGLSPAELENRDLRHLDLSYMNLAGLDLSGRDLSGANLRHATLSHANLHSANLRCADLSFANLRGANLRDANLSSANLECIEAPGAILVHVDCRSTILCRANLRNADLSYGNFQGANLSQAILDGADVAHADFAGAIADLVSHQRMSFDSASNLFHVGTIGEGSTS